MGKRYHGVRDLTFPILEKSSHFLFTVVSLIPCPISTPQTGSELLLSMSEVRE
jgi:hypothetical protein